MNKGIPENVIEELKLKIEESEPVKSKIIVEPHQVSIKIPKDIKNELDLPVGSIPCTLFLKDKKTIIVKVKKK